MKNDIIISGVGGQGIIAISGIIGISALDSNLYFKQSEVHGMSQRGGDVQSHFRLSDMPVFSDLIPFGGADLIISVEPLESLRHLPWLSGNGWLITNSNPFLNIPEYPPSESVLDEIRKVKNNIIIDADTVAMNIGSRRSGNMVILGAAARFINIPVGTIENAVRKFFGNKGDDVIRLNIEAFKAGMNLSRE
jgi:indolepyruvate ferredoxin oxidoreductase beta subunit